MDIHTDLMKNGSFPKGKRPLCYQEYYLDNKWNKGQREIVNRAILMNLNPQSGETVVEIGCQIGGFMQYCHLEGAKCIGIDIDSDYIRLAKKLADLNNHNIEYIEEGVNLSLLDKIKDRFKEDRIDHLLLLSMGKHIGEKMLFNIIDTLKPKNIYIETNAINENNKLPHYNGIKKRGGVIVGETHDRNDRILYSIKL